METSRTVGLKSRLYTAPHRDSLSALTDEVSLHGRLTFCPTLNVRLKLLFGLDPMLQIPALSPACLIPKLVRELCNFFVLICSFCCYIHATIFPYYCLYLVLVLESPSRKITNSSEFAGSLIPDTGTISVQGVSPTGGNPRCGKQQHEVIFLRQPNFRSGHLPSVYLTSWAESYRACGKVRELCVDFIAGRAGILARVAGFLKIVVPPSGLRAGGGCLRPKSMKRFLEKQTLG